MDTSHAAFPHGWRRWLFSTNHKHIGALYWQRLGNLHFWLTFIGVNIAFFPVHFLGLAGMPRRITDYPDGFTNWIFVSSIGSYISFAGFLVFLVVLWRTFTAGKPCPATPVGRGCHHVGMDLVFAATVP